MIFKFASQFAVSRGFRHLWQRFHQTLFSIVKILNLLDKEIFNGLDVHLVVSFRGEMHFERHNHPEWL